MGRCYIVEPGDALIVSPGIRFYEPCQYSDISSHHMRIHTTGRIAAREHILAPDAPCCDTSNDSSKGEEGSLVAWSERNSLHYRDTYDYQIVPRYPNITYTLAGRTIEGSRHADV